MSRHRNAGISLIEIERAANRVNVMIHTAKPGIIIGKSGTNVDELRKLLETARPDKRVAVNILEVRHPDLSAVLVARNIAEQLEKRVAFKRAMKLTVQRATQAGAKGIRVAVAGRLGGAEMARREWERRGRVPLHTLRADIDFGTATAHDHLRHHRREGVDLSRRRAARPDAPDRRRALGRSAGRSSPASPTSPGRRPPGWRQPARRPGDRSSRRC